MFCQRFYELVKERENEIKKEIERGRGKETEGWM